MGLRHNPGLVAKVVAHRAEQLSRGRVRGLAFPCARPNDLASIFRRMTAHESAFLENWGKVEDAIKHLAISEMAETVGLEWSNWLQDALDDNGWSLDCLGIYRYAELAKRVVDEDWFED